LFQLKFLSYGPPPPSEARRRRYVPGFAESSLASLTETKRSAGYAICAALDFAHSLAALTELLRNSLRPLTQAWYGG
jgi:hypothetical protein